MENSKKTETISFRDADSGDVAEVSFLFQEHLQENPEYISHGEMQMGIALDPYRPASDAAEKWGSYLRERIEDRDSCVLIVSYQDRLAGFIIIQIGRDGDKPFGVLNNILVHSLNRGRGIGKRLLEKGIEWFRERGIYSCYLESGCSNHFAHEFFGRQGFVLISHTFHQIINDPSELDFSDKNED